MKNFIDFDGVLGDMEDCVKNFAWQRYGKIIKDIPCWGIAEALGVQLVEESVAWDYIWRHYSQLYEGAEGFLAMVPGAEIVTNRPSGPARENFHNFFYLRMNALAPVHFFENWKQKEDFILREKPEALLEDNLKFLLRMRPSATRLFLLDRAWNQSADLGGHYTRVMNYDEFLAALP